LFGVFSGLTTFDLESFIKPAPAQANVSTFPFSGSSSTAKPRLSVPLTANRKQLCALIFCAANPDRQAFAEGCHTPQSQNDYRPQQTQTSPKWLRPANRQLIESTENTKNGINGTQRL
jgi:hypothetical protein